MTPTPTIHPESDGRAALGFTVERTAGGLSLSVAPVPPARRLLLGTVSTVAILLGPLAAAVMLAAGMGWVGPLVILGLILTPAILLRVAVVAAERGPAAGPDVVFRVNAETLELTTQTRDGPRTRAWSRAAVGELRPGWLATGLVVRAGGRVAAEVLPWHPLALRKAVAQEMNAALAGGRPRGPND